jgi:hypothetical protein
MKTCDWQERVAMLLDQEEAAAREHVTSCSACADLLAELESDRDLLRSSPVPDMRLPRIRRRPPVWVWAAAAAVLLSIWLWPRPAAVEPLEIAVRAPAAPEITRSEPRQVAARPRKRPTQPRLAEALEAALPPLVHPPVAANGEVVVAMQTEDPNVIIVLVQGDSDE